MPTVPVLGQLGRLAVVPPSIGMMAPVMYAARSEARNDASSATSSGWPPPFRAEPATSAGNRAAAPFPPDISVSMKPGQIAFARMPCSPYSMAAALGKAIPPAWAPEKTRGGRGEPFMPPIDDQFRITPPPVATIVL